MDILGIQQPSGKLFPTFNILDFVKEENTLPISKVRITTIIGVWYSVQVGCSHWKQPFIFKVQVKYRILGKAFGQKVGDDLIYKTGLPRPPHPDDRIYLSGQPGQYCVAQGTRWDGSLMKVGDELLKQCFHMKEFISFSETNQADFVFVSDQTMSRANSFILVSARCR